MSYPYQHSQGGYGYHPQQQQTPVSNYPPQQPLDTHTPQGSYSPYQSAPIDYRHYQQIPQQGYNQFAYQPSQANVVNYELPTSTFAQYPQHPTYTQYQQTPAATPSRPVQRLVIGKKSHDRTHDGYLSERLLNNGYQCTASATTARATASCSESIESLRRNTPE